MKISLKLTFVLAFLETIINRLIKKEDSDLSNVSPKFIKVETMPSQTETFLKFNILDKYPFEYKYRLFIGELDRARYQSNLNLFKNWLYEDEDYDLFLENDNTLWKKWDIFLETNERIIKITNLSPSKIHFSFLSTNKLSINNLFLNSIQIAIIVLNLSYLISIRHQKKVKLTI